MIFKKQVYQPNKKAHPLIGVLLFTISVVLLLVTGPIGFVYGLFHTLFKSGFRGVSAYVLKIAISIDQLGNVLMQHLLNVLWVKKDGYPFGNRDETISSALGRNRKLGKLTLFGRGIDQFLDLIDPNHSLNSIDYYIEPSDNIIDKLAWVVVRNFRLLAVRSTGKTLFYIPGGKRAEGETDTGALIREVREELRVELDPETVSFFGVFEAQADGQPPGVLVKLRCFEARYSGELTPTSEIEEMAFLSLSEKNKLSRAGRLVMEFLAERDLVR